MLFLSSGNDVGEIVFSSVKTPHPDKYSLGTIVFFKAKFFYIYYPAACPEFINNSGSKSRYIMKVSLTIWKA